MNKVRSGILGGLLGAVLAVAAAAGLLLFLNKETTPETSEPDSSFDYQVVTESTPDAEDSADESAESTDEESEATLEIELKKTDYTYTGKAITPEFTVKLNGKTLSDAEYETAVSDNVEVGKATLKVTSGEVSEKVDFKIVPPAPKVKLEYDSTDTTVTIRWEKVEQAQYYSVSKYTGKKDDKDKDKDKDASADEETEEEEDSEAEAVDPADVPEEEKPVHCANIDAEESEYTEAALDSGTVYRYVIRSCAKIDNKIYASGFSDEIEVITLPSKPGMPSLSADGKAVVWSSVPKCDGYEVLVAESGKEPKVYADTKEKKETAKFSAKGTVTVMVRAYITIDKKKYYGQSSDPALIDQAAQIAEEEEEKKEEEHEDGTMTGLTSTGSKQIEVENIMQYPELPTGCETTALTILLRYYGYNADKLDIARNYLPKLDFYWEDGEMYGADYHNTFAGNPENESSYGCYAPCIVTAANSYLSAQGASMRAQDISGSDLDSLLTGYIDNDTPVLIWITSSDLHETALTTVWKTPEGTSVQWVAYEHCVVLTGYDAEAGLIYVSDPLVGNTSYSYDRLRQRYIDMGRQAVTLS